MNENTITVDRGVLEMARQVLQSNLNWLNQALGNTGRIGRPPGAPQANNGGQQGKRQLTAAQLQTLRNNARRAREAAARRRANTNAQTPTQPRNRQRKEKVMHAGQGQG